MYEGQLVRLRAYRKEDVDRALTFINHPDIVRLVNTGAGLPYTRWDEEKWIEANSATKDTYNFAIETLADQLYIGGCGINELSWKNRSCVIGIMIGDPHYHGKGYGTDAMRVFVRFLFEQMGMNRVALNVFAFNERARKCYEKVGFVQEGTTRQSLYRDGQFHDEYVMSILRAEYDASAQKG